jgi:predicted secreted hydrolase
MPRWIALVLIAAAIGGAAWSLQPPPKLQPRAELSGLLPSADMAGYARALQPRPFTFPRDHGPHDEYQTEWWYYTGNLADANGRHFGYQLTIFRRAIAPQATPTGNTWTTNQVYIAHFAITDSAAGSHKSFERLARGAAGIAGASGEPYRVWIEDWRIEALDVRGDEVRLVARDGMHAIDLTLRSQKPIVKHGNDGLSQKSSEAGNASYYYSLTRNATTGSIQTPDGTFAVTGNSWLDREWSTSALGSDVSGWDWFAIQLEDGRDLMLYKLRRGDGSDEPVSAGTLVEADGTTHRIAVGNFDARALAERWTAPSGAAYPLRWRIDIPAHSLALDVSPRINAQEMKLGIATYWEGAISVRGTSNGRAVTGLGYLELTGYRETMKGRL